MKRFAAGAALCFALLAYAAAQNGTNPFLGRWDFNLITTNGMRASWLGVKQNNGALEVWYQPTGGNVYQIQDYQLDGDHLTMTVSRGSGKRGPTVWALEARNGKLIGKETRGATITTLTGVRAPELKRAPPDAWTDPQPLFNGRNLDGWEPIGDVAHNHWVVKDGLLVNEAHGANLRTNRKFEDFKLHFEVNCPDRGNSGFYLRGRYEVQLEYEPLSANPVERRMGSIYGRIAPAFELPRTPGEWETFDVMLVGRTVTIMRNKVITINQREIEGITGGALDANEGEPGPFYIQGDHTGGLKFRNITVAVPK